jgi:hypothetical protein
MQAAVAHSWIIVPLDNMKTAMCCLNLLVRPIIFTRKLRITMTQKERRKSRERDVWNLSRILNQHQKSALNQIELSGWQVFCVRISIFQDPVVIVVNSEGDAFATLEYDGELNLTPDLSFRRDDLGISTVKKTSPPRTSAYLQRQRLMAG